MVTPQPNITAIIMPITPNHANIEKNTEKDEMLLLWLGETQSKREIDALAMSVGVLPCNNLLDDLLLS